MDVNPGSPEAILKGCLCARLDNNWGAGMYTDPDGVTMFSMRGDCPIHGFADYEFRVSARQIDMPDGKTMVMIWPE